MVEARRGVTRKRRSTPVSRDSTIGTAMPNRLPEVSMVVSRPGSMKVAARGLPRAMMPPKRKRNPSGKATDQKIAIFDRANEVSWARTRAA